MNDTVTRQTSQNVYATWANIFNVKGENGIYITPPCSGTYRIRKFIASSQTQRSYFHENPPTLLLIDGYEREDFSFTDLQHQILIALDSAADTLDTWFMKHPGRIGIFLTRIDTPLRKGNLHALQYLTPLLERQNQVSLILVTELNIPESPLFSQLVKTSPVVQNIHYRPIRSVNDARQFLLWIEHFWDIQIPQSISEGLLTYLGSHYWLLKEGVRLARDHPHFSLEDILLSHSLVRKGITIFQRLSTGDQATVLSLLKGTPVACASEYLSRTKLVHDKTIGLFYWDYIKDHLFQVSLPQAASDVIVHLTPLEQTVFTLLMEKQAIVSRDTIAQALWKDTTEEKYSDWAIDQLVHRIREKLALTGSSYRIETKKKLGFVLHTFSP